MFRIWSGPEGSSHKEPLSGIRIHRAHGLSFCAVLPNRAMLDAARHPERQFVIQKARHDQKVYALPFSCQLVRSGWRSLTLPKHRRPRGPGVMEWCLAGPRLCLRDRSTTKYLAAGLAVSSKNHPQGRIKLNNSIPCPVSLDGCTRTSVVTWFGHRGSLGFLIVSGACSVMRCLRISGGDSTIMVRIECE